MKQGSPSRADLEQSNQSRVGKRAISRMNNGTDEKRRKKKDWEVLGLNPVSVTSDL